MAKQVINIRIEVDLDSDFIKKWTNPEHGLQSAVEDALSDLQNHMCWSPESTPGRVKGVTAEDSTFYKLTSQTSKKPINDFTKNK